MYANSDKKLFDGPHKMCKTFINISKIIKDKITLYLQILDFNLLPTFNLKYHQSQSATVSENASNIQ